MRGREGGGALVLVLSLVTVLAVAAGIGVAGALRACRLEAEVLAGTRAALAAEDALALFLDAGWRNLGTQEPGTPLRREMVLPSREAFAARGWYEGRILEGPPGEPPLARVRYGAALRRPSGPAYRQEREAWIRLGEVPEIIAWRLVR